ncbi:MAG: M48 family peptidase [Proteobacteria bacterium]|nr:M48 family peptidase [Pseudomonadota bacterium]
MFFSRQTQPPVSSAPPQAASSSCLENLRLVRSKAARRLALRVDPARGDICLVVPVRTSEKKAWQFAEDNLDWIEQRLARLPKPIPFEDGVIIPIFGKPRLISIVPCSGRVTTIDLTSDALVVQTPRADASTNIKRYLYSLLHDVAAPLAATKARSIGRRVNKLQFRDTRARWGSCGVDGDLMLCWRLVFAPIEVIDYVVAHEVAHLKHMDHSPRFWSLCDQLSEDMNFACNWLKINGDKLLTYGIRP